MQIITGKKCIHMDLFYFLHLFYIHVSTTNFCLEQKPSHQFPAKKKNTQWIHTIHALTLHLVPIPSVKSLHTWSSPSCAGFSYSSNFFMAANKKERPGQRRWIETQPVISAPVWMWQLFFVFALDGLQWKREMPCKCELFCCQDAGCSTVTEQESKCVFVCVYVENKYQHPLSE